MKFSIFVSLSIMFICVFVMLSIVACRYVKLILSVELVVFLGSVIVRFSQRETAEFNIDLDQYISQLNKQQGKLLLLLLTTTTSVQSKKRGCHVTPGTHLLKSPETLPCSLPILQLPPFVLTGLWASH